MESQNNSYEIKPVGLEMENDPASDIQISVSENDIMETVPIEKIPLMTAQILYSSDPGPMKILPLVIKNENKRGVSSKKGTKKRPSLLMPQFYYNGF